jgi:predicted permease
MSIAIFFPLIYLFVGLGLGRMPYEIKGRASALLTKLVTPLIIIYNISIGRSGVFFIMIGVAIIMSVMLAISRAFVRDPLQNLCFCYLNIGWIGLPIATALFGNGAAVVIISAYVGSSLFGNSVGVGLMSNQGQYMKTRILQTIKAPPVLALVIGIACIPIGGVLEQFARPGYEVLKFLMGFLGMIILGIWLAESSLKLADLRNAFIPFIYRAITLVVLISLFIAVCQRYNIALVTENKAVLYLICLLPPAANIIVLETHYMKSGRSAAMIAWGTCLSIVTISLYAGALMAWNAA